VKIKIILIFFIIINSCKDTDLIIENVNFSESTLEYCTASISNPLFLKIKGSEVLILLISSVLPYENGVTIRYFDQSTSLVYRKYDSNVTKEYFCSILTPSSPNLLTELLPVNGELEITTKLSLNESGEITYLNYDLKVLNLLLENENGDTLIQDTLELGSYGYPL
tara:strand:- start:1014 stop:1511 length:498 start_codon:yes stop_codon:yes gene_type:complete